jgi:type I restriction enzyme, S subunit
MELKPGYKQTEVGMIPEEWETFQLKGISTKITDGEHVTPQRTTHGYYLLSARNVLNGKIDISDVDYVGAKEYRRIRQRCAPEAGDILISCSGSIGRIAVVPVRFECVLVRSAALVKINQAKVDSLFIQYWLQADHAQEQISYSVNQGAQPNLFLNHIERLKCPIPPLAEQRAIAEALSDADALIESLEQLIAKKRAVKQGAMQDLLIGKRRLPGFEGEWEVKHLGDLGSTYGGLTGKSKSDFGSGNSHYITFMNIMSNVVIDCTLFELVKVLSTESQNRVIKGDLFFNGSSETPEEVGMCAFLTEDVQNVYLNSFCFGFRLYEGTKAEGLYLAYFFRSREGRELLKSLAQGAIRYNLSKTALLKVAFPLPPASEQTAIAAALSDMDAEIAALEAKLAKAHQVKQGMMQELLTGRIRLV